LHFHLASVTLAMSFLFSRKLNMIVYKPRLWMALGVSAIALAGVAGCQPDGEAGTKAANGTTSAASSTAGEGEGEGAKIVAPAPTASPSVGGESGEAGASNAYSGVDPASWLGLRISHLGGFLLVAEKSFKAGQVDEASILIEQGLLEVYDTHAAELSGQAKDLQPSYKAVIGAIDGKKPKGEIERAFAQAFKTTREAQSKAGANQAEVVKGMLNIAAGLYSGVVHPDGNDPTEYQHAYGAALAALEASQQLSKAQGKDNGSKLVQLNKDVGALITLFPTVTLPETPASTASVAAAASRAELSLSGIK
jgi:hypothetical protein